MPEGGSRLTTPTRWIALQDRYEDYIVKDLISEVESKFPAAGEREKRAIVGVSMGGFGAVKLALVHPELFVFAGGMSSAIDVPSRPIFHQAMGAMEISPCNLWAVERRSSTQERSICAGALQLILRTFLIFF